MVPASQSTDKVCSEALRLATEKEDVENDASVRFLLVFVGRIFLSEELLAQVAKSPRSFIDAMSHVKRSDRSEATQLHRYEISSRNETVPPLLRATIDVFPSCAEHPCAGMNIAIVLEAPPLCPTCIASPASIKKAPSSFEIASSSARLSTPLAMSSAYTLRKNTKKNRRHSH
jgi:hypothetical protein